MILNSENIYLQGDLILAVDWNDREEQSLVIYDLQGLVLKKIPLSQEVVTSLDWLDERQFIMVVRNSEGQKEIRLVSEEANSETLFKSGLVNLGYITVSQGRILVESPQSGIDNLFELKSGTLHQLTNSKFGAYAPALDEEMRLIYNEYTATGMGISVKPGRWDEVFESNQSFLPFYEKLVLGESKFEFEQKLLSKTDYPVKPYQRKDHAINLHSWLLLAPPLSPEVSVTGFSRDLLNNFALTAGGSYHLIERAPKIYAGLAFTYFYPVMDLSLSYGGRRQEVVVNDFKKEDQWEEGVVELGLAVPWQNIIGRFNQRFTLRAFSRLIRVMNKLSLDDSEISDGHLFSPGGELNYSFLSRTAYRDFFPSWGASLFARWEEGHDLSGAGQEGAFFSIDSKYFLPGILAHHAFYHQLAFEKQRDSSYQYQSLILPPRGFSQKYFDEFLKYSSNYTLPIAYTDWNWSRYIYIKRIGLNGFYDQLNGTSFHSKNYLASTGIELFFETHFFRLFFPITWGVRGNYIINGEATESYDLFLMTPAVVF
jgi:hypothetical protein